MANLDLSKYGIQDVKEIIHNPSYDVLFAEETKPGLEGFEKGQVTELGAVNVMTGIYTGRSPKDKFFVMNEASKDSVWWTSDEYKNDNKPCSEEAWADLKAKAVKELSGKRLFVVDTFCGANPATRMKVRFIMEVAWQAHFVTNMFIRPTAEELANYGEPDFVSFNASKAKVDNYKELGLNSETATVFNLKTNEQVILNTWYGGEMKKGMFSIMNYKNPLRGIASMHCSANTNMKKEEEYEVINISSSEFINQLDFLQDNYDIILVDFPGNLKQNGVVETLHFVDVIIIPFEPNQTDLRPTLTFYYNIYEGIIESRRKIGKKTTVRGVMNRVLPNVLEFKEILKNKKTLPFELMQNYIKDSRVDYQRNLSTLSKAYHHPCDAFCEEVLELICNHIGE